MNLYWAKFQPGHWYLFDKPKGTPREPIGHLIGTKDCGGFCCAPGKGWDSRIEVRAKTVAAARARLEKEIDRRSIGLFNDDNVDFVVET